MQRTCRMYGWEEKFKIGFWCGTPEEKECLKELDTHGRITAHGSDLEKKYDGRAWTGLIWLMTGTSGRMLWTEKGNLRFRKMQGISQLGEGLDDSQAGLQSMTLVIKICLSTKLTPWNEVAIEMLITGQCSTGSQRLMTYSHCSAHKSLSLGHILNTLNTRVGTLIMATIYLQLIQNRYMFRSFTVLQRSHQHCVQPVASDVKVVGYL